VLFIENTGVRMPGIRDASRIKHRIRNWLKGVKGIRKEMDNLYVFSPVLLPFPYSRIATRINRSLILHVLKRWMRLMDFSNPIVWTFLPTRLSLDLIEQIDNRIMVYYCIADFEKLVRNPLKLRKTELRLAEKADLIFAQGKEIKRRFEKHNTNVSIFPFGVNIDKFTDAGLAGEKPVDITHLNGVMLGYIGGIHKHIDFSLVRFLAERNPDWTLLFIGPSQTDISPVRDLPNIVFLDMKGHKELAGYVNNFDVCLIPYVLNEYTRTVYPTKLNEYFAMGKPVVSTALPEMTAFNERYNDIVYISEDKEAFEKYIKKALREDNGRLKKRRIEIARENSWDARIEQMSNLIETGIEKRRVNKDIRWKEDLITLYKKTRGKIVRFALACFVLYFLFFKTSFVWFLANPLRVDEAPIASDAIVVFAGGVGESGKAGQGYEERVHYAVELYKKGFAKKLIFSSGYIYAMREAEVMRALAISMGVPHRNILLEDKAKNTYENVIFTTRILDRHGWGSVLLVSSPYHMKRVELVYRKTSPDRDIVFTPVPDSLFYEHANNAQLRQIKALLHEYLAIVFYRLKGYL